MKNELYLEISGRQTGKTERLIHAAAENVLYGNYSIIYLLDQRLKKEVQHGLTDAVFQIYNKNHKDNFNVEKYEDYQNSWMCATYGENVYSETVKTRKSIRKFYDEFDLYENAVSFDPNGYYATTLKNLIDLNKSQSENPGFWQLYRNADIFVNHRQTGFPICRNLCEIGYIFEYERTETSKSFF